MYTVQEIAPASTASARTLESLYTGQSELYAHLKSQFGSASEEAERQHRVVRVVENFCRLLRDEAQSSDAASILGAFVNGSTDSQMLAAELAVHYVVYDVLEITAVARSLRMLLKSDDPGVANSATAAATFLRDCEVRDGPYDELTQHCLQSEDAIRLTSVEFNQPTVFLYVVPE
jgi:hypothetical protein